jgi:molybdenum cofactor guanylyltransferase
MRPALTPLDAAHRPTMVDVGDKAVTLRETTAELLQQPNPQALDNVNTPEEHATIMSGAENPASQPVRVQYFALLREQAGRSGEALDTCARTPRELYEELRARHPFTLGPDMLRGR